MTPQMALSWLRPAFLDLFKDDRPDLARFLRLAIDVFDPDPGYQAICAGEGCGFTGLFRTATENGKPYGFQCPKCGAVYLWAFFKSPTKASSRIILTSDGSSIVGHCRAESDSGVVITDASVEEGNRNQ